MVAVRGHGATFTTAAQAMMILQFDFFSPCDILQHGCFRQDTTFWEDRDTAQGNGRQSPRLGI
jgi:hypothetical protein